MSAFVEGFTQGNLEIEESPNMPGKSEGGIDRGRPSFFLG